MRDRFTLLCPVLGLLLASGPAFAEQLDQQQTNSSGGGSSFNAVTWVGQTFVPSITGALTRLEASLFCFQCVAGASPDIIVEVRTTSSGLPNGTVLATTNVAGFSGTSSAFHTAVFSSPAMLTAGTTYAFVLRAASTRAPGTYAASFSTTAASYPNGARVGSSNSGQNWTIISTGGTARDLTFRTFMKLAQHIDFAPLANRIVGEGDFNVAATATSRLPVSFAASGACSVSGTMVHITGVGACTLTATQEGDETYVAAEPVMQTLAVTYAPSGPCLGSPGHQVLPPLAVDGSSVVRQNATVPVKFRVCDANGTSVGPSDVVTSFTLAHIVQGTRTSDVTVDPAATTPDGAFRWDPTAQQWIFNLSTKDLAAGATYVYRIGLADGTWIDFSVGVR